MNALTTQSTKPTISADLQEKVLLGGDLSVLTSAERLSYYNNLCESLGLNPLSRPFEYQKFQGQLKLYARKDCTEQLRSIKNVSITETQESVVGDLFIVKAHGELPDGRKDSEIGVVCIAGLKGDAKANAMMKAHTKAKRRLTLSICGLGMLDETELETIPELKNIKPIEEEKKPIHLTDHDKEDALNLIYNSEDIDALKVNFIQIKKKIKSIDPKFLEEIIKAKDEQKEILTKKLSQEFFGDEEDEHIQSKE